MTTTEATRQAKIDLRSREHLSELYQENARQLRLWLRLRVHAPDVEDTAQEVWARISAKYQTHFRGGNFRAWMFTIGRNYIVDRLRRSRDAAAIDGIPDSQLISKSPEPVDVLIRAERQERLKSCLSRLSSLRRKIVTARLRGSLYPEIARETGLSEKKTYAHFFAAKNILRRCVSSEEPSR